MKNCSPSRPEPVGQSVVPSVGDADTTPTAVSSEPQATPGTSLRTRVPMELNDAQAIGGLATLSRVVSPPKDARASLPSSEKLNVVSWDVTMSPCA